MATAPDLSPGSSKKLRPGSSSLKSPTSGSAKGIAPDSVRKTSRPASAGPTATSSSLSGISPTNLPTVLVSEASAASFPSRVVGWKTSKSFSKTLSSIEVPAAGASRTVASSSTSRPAAIRIQMMEPVGPSAYSLSLQAQRTPSEQWKMLKNRLLRKKSSEENITPELIDKIKQTIRSPQEEGIVCRTNELKRLMRGSETSDGAERGTRSSNRSSIDESEKGAEACVEDEESNNSSDSEKEDGDDDDEKDAGSASSKVKWDESNTLDASVLGDAIQAFLKGLKTTSSPSRCTEKRVSFR